MDGFEDKRMKINDKNAIDINFAVAEKAFYWAMKFENGDHNASDREEFVKWLKKSPEHIHEYILTMDTWKSLDDIEQLDQQTIEALMEESGSDNNVITLPSASHSMKQHKAPHNPSTGSSFRFPKSFAALAAMLVISLIVLFYPSLSEDSVYTTLVGEQRSWTLQDGSILHLNTMSRIKISYSEKQRLVELTTGEALFDVAHDKKRPFYVKTDDVVVRAVGTSFNVYRGNRDDRKTVVTVVEGKIAVSAPDNKVEYSAQAGEQVAVKQGKILETSPGDVNMATAWRQRKLVFRSRTLNEVVNEFNRYNRLKMLITSENVGVKGITGIFDADKPDDLIKFLEIDRAIQITKLNNKVIISDAPLN
jgi:transmembrane sensor